MKKLLKFSSVSMLAIMTASGANAAGYTCEELIEYTSCNDGYYLNSGKCIEGSACVAGNYLAPSCPEVDSEYFEYVSNYEDDDMPEGGWCYSESQNCSMEHWCVTTKDECEGDGNVWYGLGCVLSDEGSFDNNPDLFVSFSYNCTPCAAGTYQDIAGQYECKICPAGSYCATAGLSNPTNVCAKGSYSLAGATTCTTCPATGLTDKSGATVIATTPTTGATTLLACVIDDTVNFIDAKGTYHYKSNCEFIPNGKVDSAEECEALAEATGEEWYWDSYSSYCTMNIGIYAPNGDGLYTIIAPSTESECSKIPSSFDGVAVYFYDGKCYCDGNRWTFGPDGLMCDIV
ncbi:MAG: hypothetical protein IKB10_00710 [Alphaproteobacteria bacterium]|nr:hypothetical protein [Alphaproteobacteria bacterium]